MAQVKGERERRGWSQHELGRRCGLPASTISAIECGATRIWPGWRKRLARAFKMREAELFPEGTAEATRAS
jgi:transcriptional regulator with XRE-family HTH domain